MFKVLGSIAVILASGLIGMRKYSELYERKRMLCAVRDGAERIRDNLRCKCMPLYDCFLCGGEFFEKAASHMSEGVLPSVAVRNAADSETCFSKEDAEIIYRFSDGLCSENCDGQMRNLEIFLSETQKNIDNATTQLDTKGKLFIKGSLLTATAIVLILI